jgi:beta-glucosidase
MLSEDQFPSNFLWGVSTSSYQIEGNNSNADWWEWEEQGKTKEKSGLACDSWNRWREDHELLTQLGVNAYRLSLEWSRLEPEEGKFSEEAFSHYREILADLRNRKIKTVVTFWHWTSPLWFSQKYGWHSKQSVAIFCRYSKEVFNRLGDLIDIAVTMNEPMVPLVHGYLLGKFPPGKKSWGEFKKAACHMACAHNDVYDYAKIAKKEHSIGITTLYNYFNPVGRYNPLERLYVKIAKKFWNEMFFEKIMEHTDYFGLDYYFHQRLGMLGKKNKNQSVSDMGWEIYPQGLEIVVKEIYRRYNMPIYILENGLADAADAKRARFISDHIASLQKARKDGADVRGYFHWSLLDNFEWLYGFSPRFGLVAMDYKKMERQPRPSFYAYQEIIKKLT